MADLAAASAAVGDAAASWRAFLPSREAVVEALRQYPPLDARHLPYGTSGFRSSAERLPAAAHRCGLFAGLFSLALSLARGEASPRRHSPPSAGCVVGVVVTASHNPASDNGLKVTGPSGALLSPFLESLLERLVNAHLVRCALEEASQGGRRSAGELSADAAIEAHADCFFAVAEQLFEHASCLAADEEATLPQGMQGEAFPTSPPAAAASEFSEEEQAQARSRLHSMGACVLQARDSRASSLALEEALTAGVSLVGVQSVRLGVAATGQLQFLVLLCNEALSGVSPPRLPEKQHQALRAALYALRSCQENRNQQRLQHLGKLLLDMYFRYFEQHMSALVDFLRRGNFLQGSVASSPVYVDCGNGAGSPACGELQKLLRLLGEKPLFARNTGLNTTSSSDTTSSDCSGSHLINENCGAEFVQKGVRLPQRFGFPKDASEGAPCCAFDGDADRIVYFAWQRQQTPSDECSSSGFSSLEDSPAVAAANDEETMRVQLFDGDRIACLFVLLIASLLKAAEENRVGNSLHKTTAARVIGARGDSAAYSVKAFRCRDTKIAHLESGREQANDAPAAALEPLRVGVVQTAYANGGSTRFLENLSKTVQQWEYLKIQIELRCVKTGVKNLHREASQFPLSVYFEANGHGTVLSHPAELAAWGVKVGIYQTEAFQFLQHFVALFNPATGDALADLLGVEIARTRLSLSLSQWHLLYDEFPSITAKVVLPRSFLSTLKPHEGHEMWLLEPEALQAALWDLANSTGPFCRVFVRPSGTEDVARIYAEAPHRREAQKLADAAAQIVLQFAQSEVADRGVQV
ncbi:phosphoacetylglucosamine mutase [Cyclospora cayetanensis]|uniref:Phosphoacetylglucosamine mutase n=1 Tax=Cyclospora cayetanensis TaxID=88456 RepID=A0A1D3CS68_9EIME|nr:phosphoacetylglucosamine mutase [Cyclospora cayetanensis]